MPGDARQAISDRLLKALQKLPLSERSEIMDASRPAFGIRVSPKGKISFFAIARFGASKNPSRRVIGTYGSETDTELRVYTLADAAAVAERWRRMAPTGKDPKHERERAQRANKRRAENTFKSVAEAFIAARLADKRKGEEVEADIRREFIAKWDDRPISDIDRADVIAVVKAAKDRGANYQAIHLLGYAKLLFDWAVEIGEYGLDKSPCDRLRPRTLGLTKVARSRILSEPELRAYWNAAGGLGYPYGPAFQILALTGQRKSEIAEARRPEIDLDKRLLVIPPERMKSGVGHVVPLTESVIQILEEMPKFSGDYLFSTTFGKKPINGFSKAKSRLDAEMLKILRDGADDPEKIKLPPFVLHDVRRTMRSALSALPVEQHVRELVIGHTQKGLHKVYDLHAYLDEKRRALELWAARLNQIVSPPPDNVIRLDEARQSA